jgi:phosphatidylinositol glycan class N
MRRFLPFAPLSSSSSLLPGADQVVQIQALIAAQDYPLAMHASRALLELALQGSAYVQTYDWLLLVCLISAAYLGSVAYTIVHLLEHYVLSPTSPSASSSLGTLLGLTTFALLSCKFALDCDPPIYYLYALFPSYFWAVVIDSRHLFHRAFALGRSRYSSDSNASLYLSLSLAARAALALAALQLMVLGYLERIAWTMGLLAIGFLWPALFMSSDMRTEMEGTLLAWGLTCLACAGFAVQGTEKEESVPLL